MQGRLVEKYRGRYQAHPLGYWEREFEVAAELGLDCIEFILDYNDSELNPLMSDEGVAKIKTVCASTGVEVKTICADYFMEAPLHSEDSTVVDKSMAVLMRLLDSSQQLGVSDIVIPCVDQSSLQCTAQVERFVANLNSVLPVINKSGVNLSLETDLDAQPFAMLLARFDSNHVTVNYDIGNSAALGYDPVKELEAYGHRITDIHIKDRTLGGGPVVLGEGDADFERFFEALKAINYRGPFIMQAYRDDEGVEIFKRQQQWMGQYLSNIGKKS